MFFVCFKYCKLHLALTFDHFFYDKHIMHVKMYTFNTNKNKELLSQINYIK